MGIRHILLLVAICVLLTMIACSEKEVISEVISTDVLDALVVSNSEAVQDAAEAFAMENNGWYPENISADTTSSGKTLVDFLPGGERLVNPFTDQRTEPVMKPFAMERGETAYDSRWGCAYTVTGRGDSHIIITLSDLPVSEHLLVEANCLAVQAATEEFAARNNAIYPANVDVDENLDGNTVIDLLPGGQLLQNPFTLVNTEPINGAAASPGQIGFVPVIQGGAYVGYVITGHGRRCLIITIAVPSLY